MAIAEEIHEVREQAMAHAGDPDERYPAPSAGTFESTDFAPAADLAKIAEALIGRHKARFQWLRMCQMDYLWKAKGGESAGKATLGKCQKAAGLVKHYSGATFVIWLAADHVRDLGLSRYQVEALLFHEMSHASYDAEKSDFTVLAHDFAGFRSEIEFYGLWVDDLREMGRSVLQLGLPGLAVGGA